VGQLREALSRLLADPQFERVRISSLYRTEPVGMGAQPWFVNGVAWVRTRMDPRQTMDRLHRIEREMGRVRAVPGGPRVIDLDLLLYGEKIVEGPLLRVPHPRLHQRRFALLPLSEIAAHAIHPVLRKTVGDLLAELEDGKEALPLGEWEVHRC
jgi:2-amino-4-hydroxy-6-hydroxymethyldihydropteridine diphosphokinase